MGAMDCSEPSTFNEKVEWYEGKGFWLDYPTVRCSEGRWVVDLPEAFQSNLVPSASFQSLEEIFDLDSRLEEDQHFNYYKRHLRGVLQTLSSEGRKFGALMLEPVILGAGGMIFV